MLELIPFVLRLLTTSWDQGEGIINHISGYVGRVRVA